MSPRDGLALNLVWYRKLWAEGLETFHSPDRGMLFLLSDFFVPVITIRKFQPTNHFKRGSLQEARR